MDYRIAAEGVGAIKSGGIRAGRRIAQHVRVPAGQVHAFDPATDTVLCGAELASLVRFDDHP